MNRPRVRGGVGVSALSADQRRFRRARYQFNWGGPVCSLWPSEDAGRSVANLPTVVRPSSQGGRTPLPVTFLDSTPINPYDARSKLIATLILLSQLGAVRSISVRAPVTPKRAYPTVPPRGGRVVHRGQQTRPPRSC
jgi:hypothetical protein